MKKLCCLIILFAGSVICKGQNLVPNGDFEQYSGCPNTLNQFDSASFWHNPTAATPDYFNQCDTVGIVDIPYHTFNGLTGYQPAHSGGAYAGIILYTHPPNMLWREYIQVQTTSPLVSNTCYHFEMYINLWNHCNYAVSELGVYFSPHPIGNSLWTPLHYTPHINNTTGFITDTAAWILIAGNYTAIGGENYLTIGNFKNNMFTNYININNLGVDHSYVYIDDVSLTPCTGISEQTQNEAITIYPHPVKDELFIKGYPLTGKTEIIIRDILGKEIYRDQYPTSNFQLPTSNFQTGIYFIEINNGTKVIRKKFLKE